MPLVKIHSRSTPVCRQSNPPVSQWFAHEVSFSRRLSQRRHVRRMVIVIPHDKENRQTKHTTQAVEDHKRVFVSTPPDTRSSFPDDAAHPLHSIGRSDFDESSHQIIPVRCHQGRTKLLAAAMVEIDGAGKRALRSLSHFISMSAASKFPMLALTSAHVTACCLGRSFSLQVHQKSASKPEKKKKTQGPAFIRPTHTGNPVDSCASSWAAITVQPTGHVAVNLDPPAGRQNLGSPLSRVTCHTATAKKRCTTTRPAGALHLTHGDPEGARFCLWNFEGAPTMACFQKATARRQNLCAPRRVSTFNRMFMTMRHFVAPRGVKHCDVHEDAE